MNIIFILIILFGGFGFFFVGKKMVEGWRVENESFDFSLKKFSENVARSVDTSVCPLLFCEMERMIIPFFVIYCGLSSLTDYKVLFVNPVAV